MSILSLTNKMNQKYNFFLKQGETNIMLPECADITTTSQIVLKNVSVYWRFENMPQDEVNLFRASLTSQNYACLLDKMESERPEEEIPLLERDETGEDNEGYEHTSFIEQERELDWDDYIGPKAVSFEELDLKGDPQKFLEQKKKVTRIFLFKLFDKQYDPRFGDKQKELFNRLELKKLPLTSGGMMV